MSVFQEYKYNDIKQKNVKAVENILHFVQSDKNMKRFSGNTFRHAQQKVLEKGFEKTYKNIVDKIEDIFYIDVNEFVVYKNKHDMHRIMKIIINAKSHISNYALLFA